MKDAAHHRHQVQKKVLRSIRQEEIKALKNTHQNGIAEPKPKMATSKVSAF